jgi:hypothetical protein
MVGEAHPEPVEEGSPVRSAVSFSNGSESAGTVCRIHSRRLDVDVA